MGLIDELVDIPEWMFDAACLNTGVEQFFAATDADQRAATATCLSCDVRVECLAYALEHDLQYGVWGGQTEQQRRAIKRAARRRARG